MIISGEIELNARRAKMRAWKRAFRLALLSRPGPEGFETLLDYADAVAADPATPRAARETWASVVEFIRLHPDVALWGPVLFPDPATREAEMDALFMQAMAIDNADN